MAQNFKKKICLIVDSLTGGGAERVAASLSIMLSQREYEVSIICLRDEITYLFEGEVFNLGKQDSKIKLVKQFYKLLRFRNAYKKIDADYYIDFRMRNRFWMELLLHLFIFDISKIIFSINSYQVFFHLPKFNWFYNEYNQAHAIICVSQAIIGKMISVFPFKNLKYVPNFHSPQILDVSPTALEIQTPYVLAVGRLDNATKQFDKLIDTYMETTLYTDKIPLYIIGEGKDGLALEAQIKQNKLKDYIQLLGFKAEVISYMKAAKFVVMSSVIEGFPNVLLESLAVGTPVISFDCQSGPSEMIMDGKNGILVENQNFDALQMAIDKMHKDAMFYNQCKSNAIISVKKFSAELVVPDWERLFLF